MPLHSRGAWLPLGLLLVGGAAPAAPAAAQTRASPQAPISAVIVYADRAQITRAQSVDCASGAAVFAGLPSTLEQKTLWATLHKTSAGNVVGVSAALEPTGPQPRAEQLQQQIRAIDEQNAELAALIDTAAGLEGELASMRDHMIAVWGQQATGAKPPVGSWDSSLDLLRQQGQASADKRRKAQSNQRELARQPRPSGSGLLVLRARPSPELQGATVVLPNCHNCEAASTAWGAD